MQNRRLLHRELSLLAVRRKVMESNMSVKNKDDREEFFSNLDEETMRDAFYGHETNDYTDEWAMLGSDRVPYKKKKKKPRRER